MASTAILILATLAAGPGVTVRVAATPSHEISPYIYGASGVSADKAVQYGLTTVRWGGNRSSRYNWKAQADNAGLGLVLPQRQGRLVVGVRRREPQGGRWPAT